MYRQAKTNITESIINQKDDESEDIIGEENILDRDHFNHVQGNKIRNGPIKLPPIRKAISSSNENFNDESSNDQF